MERTERTQDHTAGTDAAARSLHSRATSHHITSHHITHDSTQHNTTPHNISAPKYSTSKHMACHVLSHSCQCHMPYTYICVAPCAMLRCRCAMPLKLLISTHCSNSCTHTPSRPASHHPLLRSVPSCCLQIATRSMPPSMPRVATSNNSCVHQTRRHAHRHVSPPSRH